MSPVTRATGQILRYQLGRDLIHVELLPEAISPRGAGTHVVRIGYGSELHLLLDVKPRERMGKGIGQREMAPLPGKIGVERKAQVRRQCQEIVAMRIDVG